MCGIAGSFGRSSNPAAAAVVERMLAKLHKLVEAEIGEDHPPFDLDIFGTREVKYHRSAQHK